MGFLARRGARVRDGAGRCWTTSKHAGYGEARRADQVQLWPSLLSTFLQDIQPQERGDKPLFFGAHDGAP
jgi:hypothetical protein